MTIKASKKISDRTRADVVAARIAFSLDIDAIQTERVLIYYPVNTVIATAANCAASIGDGAAIPHVEKKTNYQALKKVGRGGTDTIQKLLRQRCLNLPVCHPHDLVWRLCLTRACWCYRKLILRRGLSRFFDKLSEFIELAEKVVVYPLWMRVEHLLPARRNLESPLPVLSIRPALPR